MKMIQCNGGKAPRSRGTGELATKISERHIPVFGSQTQDDLSRLTIGVISVGGLGSILIEQLMRLFPGKLMYVDNDHVELSNLNRLVGATTIDVKTNVSKVDVVTRNVLTFNPNQRITPVFGDFLEDKVQQQFRECDFIIGASDSVGVRLATNCLCLAHGIPYLDCGVGVVIKDNKLKAAGGQVIKIVPNGGFCLQCSGLFDVEQAMKELLCDDERDRLRHQGYIRGADVPALQVYSLNMMVSSWAVWTFMRMVSGDRLDYDGISVDAKEFSTRTWQESPDQHTTCPVCGEDGIVFAGDTAELLTRDSSDNDIQITDQAGTSANESDGSTQEAVTPDTPVTVLPNGQAASRVIDLGMWM